MLRHGVTINWRHIFLAASGLNFLNQKRSNSIDFWIIRRKNQQRINTGTKTKNQSRPHLIALDQVASFGEGGQQSLYRVSVPHAKHRLTTGVF